MIRTRLPGWLNPLHDWNAWTILYWGVIFIAVVCLCGGCFLGKVLLG